MSNNRECRAIKNDLLQYGKLNAVRKSRIDLHIVRCSSCKTAFNGLAFIDANSPQVLDLTNDKKATLYDRLIPSIHEIAVDLRHAEQKKWFLKPKFFWATGITSLAGVAIIAIVSVLGLFNDTFEKPRYTVAMSSANLADSSADLTEIVSWGLIDRMEGIVDINNERFENIDGKFSVKKTTSVNVKEGSRLNFRISNSVRVALIGKTDCTIKKLTKDSIIMNLFQGRLAVEFDGSSGKLLDVQTPDLLIRVRGTIFTVEAISGEATKISVVEGSVEVLPINATGSTVEVTEGKLVLMPGDGQLVDIEDEQLALAGEVADLEDNFIATSGRVVSFKGSPERVRVEIENRFIGYTPLIVRLENGPIYYRLTAPGMEPYEELLAKEQVDEQVDFSMEPSSDYHSIVASTHKTNIPIRAKKDHKKHNPNFASNQSSNHSLKKVRWNLVDRAKAAMVAGDISYAIGLLERAIDESNDLDLVTRYSLLAECYLANGRYVEAANTFDKVADLVPGTKIAQNSRYEVGRIAMDHLIDYSRARTAFTAYIASPLGGQLKETAYFLFCKLYGQEGVHRQALQCFNDFLKIYPEGYNNADAKLWRGVLYQEVEQRWADAEHDLMSFIRAKPRHPRCEESRYRIALGRYHVNDRKGALQMLEEYLVEHSGGQYEVRVERLKRAIIDPDFLLFPKSK